MARYRGPENGADGMRRLQWLMEDVFAEWNTRTHLPNIKAQQTVQFAALDVLEAGARAAAPKARLVLFGAGVHGYMRPEPDLPSGIGPAIANVWNTAIQEGYYVAGSQAVAP